MNNNSVKELEMTATAFKLKPIWEDGLYTLQGY